MVMYDYSFMKLLGKVDVRFGSRLMTQKKL